MRPTFAEIDLSAIAHNIRAIKHRVHPAQVMAVVKADAYGHGAVPAARTALANGATYLGVALLEEAIELRQQSIAEPILVFGGAFKDQLPDFFENNLEVTVYTADVAVALSQLARKFQQVIPIHVKVDTGMGRVGIAWHQAPAFISELQALPGIVVKGLYTHFATSDERNKDFARLQLARFRQVIQQLEENRIQIPLKHAANSGAILDLPETYLDMVRPGVMMYGYYPSPETSASIPIRPAMTLKSRVLFIKEVPANTSISYGRRYITQSPTRIATIPLGYADGYNRLLTNQAWVTIRGQRWPVVGRVCMDLIMADIGQNSPVQVGDEVIVFGRSEENAFAVTDICQKIGTIPYEVTCWVSRRVPRVYLE